MECNNELRAKGLMYPRTCQVCGLGPCKKSSAMTDTAPSVQPVRAWAVVDKNSRFPPYGRVYFNKLDPEINKSKWDLQFPACAPHRVIRVEIREVNDE